MTMPSLPPDPASGPPRRTFGRPTDRALLPAGGGVQPLIRLIALMCVMFVGVAGWFMMRVPAEEADLPLPSGRVEVPGTPVLPSPGGLRIRLADEARLLGWQGNSVGVFRFAANRHVLVLVFPTLAEQGAALNRLAAFVEKEGLPRDRVLDDAALAAAIAAEGTTPETYYLGHDYRAADVARFFALAARDGVELTPQERWLRVLAQQEGLLAEGANEALVAIPRAVEGIDAPLRLALLRHELSHGEFFTNPSYAAYARRFWREGLGEEGRAAFLRFLARQGYDVADEALVANEMQAYLAFSPDSRMVNPAALGVTREVFAAWQAAYLRDMPPGWLHDAFVPVGR